MPPNMNGYGFPSLPPPMFSHGQEHVDSLLDSEAAMAQARKLEQWKEALHLSPHPTPLGLTKDDCEMLEDGESEEGDEASGDIDSNASLDSTMYEDGEDDNLNGSSPNGRGQP